ATGSPWCTWARARCSPRRRWPSPPNRISACGRSHSCRTAPRRSTRRSCSSSASRTAAPPSSRTLPTPSSRSPCASGCWRCQPARADCLAPARLLTRRRIFGKREVGQFTLYDLVLILLVANAVQPAMTGPDYSLGGGLIIIGVLVLFNAGIARLDRYRVFHRLLIPPARIIIENGA